MTTFGEPPPQETPSELPSAPLPLPIAALIGAVVGYFSALSEGHNGLLLALPMVWTWTAGLGAVFLPQAQQRYKALALAVVVGLLSWWQADLGSEGAALSAWSLLAGLALAGLLLLPG